MDDGWLDGPDGLRLHPARRTVVVDQRAVELDQITFDLLEALLRRAGTFVSPAELVPAVWGHQEREDLQFVYRAISRLRRELAAAGLANAIDSAGFVMRAATEPNARSISQAPMAAASACTFSGAASEAAATAIIVVDADRRIAWANPAAAEFTGYKVLELLNLPSSEALTPEKQRDAARLAWEAVQRGMAVRGAAVIETKDRGAVPALGSWRPLDVSGQFFAVVDLWPIDQSAPLATTKAIESSAPDSQSS
jgi:PAS domain S-box-containing protein